ncbi:BAG4 regulator, partial [Turnix velox]|nr:BAG4 regulator [Turnix velox]
PPSPAPPWGYVPPDCPTEGSSLHRQQVPGYSPPQTPGMPIPQYPYGGDNPEVTAQPRATEDTWGSPLYGVQPRYGWSPAPVHGGPFLSSESHPAWSNSGVPSHPTAWDSKDGAYDRAEQNSTLHNYYPDLHHPGTLNDHKPPPSNTPRVHFSAQPQIYNRKVPSGKREAGFKSGEQPPANNPPAVSPEIQRILQVTAQSERLEQEVDEFVGKKTEKSYKLLEEMLTKLLLELDSIETGGQEGVRQARKESVHRIQAILDKLERKGL